MKTHCQNGFENPSKAREQRLDKDGKTAARLSDPLYLKY
jgi:hypothetical protein